MKLNTYIFIITILRCVNKGGGKEGKGGSKFQRALLAASLPPANMLLDSAAQNDNCPMPDQIRETDRQ